MDNSQLNELRNLIRSGEYLEKNLSDETVRNQWIFDVEGFILTLDHRQQQQVSGAIFHLKSYSSSMIRDLHRVRQQNFNLILGFLRSLYNRSGGTGALGLSANTQSIFIVHGHDDGLIDDVKACVTRLGFEPIVLREQPDKGKTIIEKLEEWLGNCKCAIVLYTPCDIGKAVDESIYENRARQNVVYEHGLFQGYLGRKRVVVLRKNDTRLPGDISGVVYTSVDDMEWQEKLESEIRAIDM